MSLSLASLFARRLREEMEERNLSGNALAKKSKVGQRSIARILLSELSEDPQKTQIPTLERVEKLARALGLPAWFLMMERGTTEQRIIRAPVLTEPDAVYAMPRRYPAIFLEESKGKKSRRKRKK